MISVLHFLALFSQYDYKIDRRNIKQFIRDLQIKEMEQIERNNELYKRMLKHIEEEHKANMKHSTCNKTQADKMAQIFQKDDEDDNELRR